MLHHGSFLARCWDNESGINFYHCAGEGRGFFMEVSIADGRGKALVRRRFVSSGPLQDYGQGVRLPEG